jgi:hypothetical protein
MLILAKVQSIRAVHDPIWIKIIEWAKQRRENLTKRRKRSSMIRRNGRKKLTSFFEPGRLMVSGRKKGDICPVISCPDSGEPFW